MCNLSNPGTLRSEIKEKTVTSNLSPQLQYACRYWVEHLKRSQRSIADEDAVHIFLRTYLLHWLEAMSLVGETSQCTRLLVKLQALVAVRSLAQNTYPPYTDLQHSQLQARVQASSTMRTGLCCVLVQL
jgi:hypothetical protein